MIEKLFHPLALQRIEGLLLFTASTWMFYELELSWILYILTLIAVDLSMAGYLVNNRIGAAIYNAGHTLTTPLIIAGTAILLDNPTWFGISLAWLAHIGIDRLVGYGLKYPHSFKSTHLQSQPRELAEEMNESAQALKSINQTRQSAKEQRKSEVVAFALEKGQITNSDVEQLVNVSDATATRYLDELSTEGILEPVGEGRSVFYRPSGSNDA